MTPTSRVRVAVYGSLLGLASLTLWTFTRTNYSPLENAPERFLAISEAVDRAAAAARYSDGEKAGLAAVQAGQLAIYEYGLALGSDREYEQLLCQRYGVTVHNVGCMPVAGEWDWQSGFTTAIKRNLALRYHRDIFQECKRDGRKLYDAKTRCDKPAA